VARGLRVLVAIAFGSAGLVLAFFGLALVLYGSERPGADPFAEIGEHKFGPDPVGGVTLALGLGAVLLSVLLIRGRSRAP
jgi:hypothetical protein